MNNTNCIRRMKEILLHDKLLIPDNFEQVVKSDVCDALNNYLNIDKGSVKIGISVNNNGEYEIKIFAVADRLKSIPTVI